MSHNNPPPSIVAQCANETSFANHNLSDALHSLPPFFALRHC